jgi:hypothetical protein
MNLIDMAIAEQKKSQAPAEGIENGRWTISADQVSVKFRRKHRRGRRSLERQGCKGHIKKT